MTPEEMAEQTRPTPEEQIPEAEIVFTVEDLPPVPPKVKKDRKVLKTIIAIAAVVALVAAGCGITAASVNYSWQKDMVATIRAMNGLKDKINDLQEQIHDNSFTGNGNSISGTATSDGLTPGQVYAQNRKSVVAISNQVTTNIWGQVSKTASSGSGFILSEDGYIVTNYHVVEGASKLTVILSDGTEYTAKLIGYEDRNDVALLKVDATGLPAVKIGSSNDLIVGDQVVAIGNPLGQLTNTLTVGYISAKDRNVTTDGSIINMLQTDAAINPGNSGGPLFNMKGEVIGITTAKYSGITSSGASIEGIGFAVPTDDVMGMLGELMEYGFISAPYIGIIIDQRADGIGVYISSIEKGTPAATAGLRAGDILVGLGEYEVKSVSDLDKVLRNFKAGDTTSIYVYRNRQVLELTITLAEKNQPAAKPTSGEVPENGSAEDWYQYWIPNFGN
jgi:serine protease Do